MSYLCLLGSPDDVFIWEPRSQNGCTITDGINEVFIVLFLMGGVSNGD
jgi:hypothetical protein